ncbi:MAG TPA: hypothetical protein VFE91_06330, partial [Nitrososphaerales archaeon]|nr:hypothetical protein [Nitrososphaerales archaeon]
RPGEPSSCVPVGYGGEATWNEFNYFGLGTSSGGGISSLYKQPAYQAGSMNKGTTLLGVPFKVTGRSTPDVSFSSAIDGGVLAYLGFIGRWAVFGGTSAASPAWASIIALLNQAHGKSVGFINPAVYKLGLTQVATALKGAFHDITSGNNDDIGAVLGAEFGVDGYTATPGYDLTTGWGTPNVSVFINNIQTFL